MRFRQSATLVAAIFIAAAASIIAQEPKCTAAARECEQTIRQMMGGRRYLGTELVELKPGLIVKKVIANSPAARSGIQANDRFIAVNGRSLTLATAREFKQLLADASRTGRLFLIVQRRGAYKKIDVRLEPYSKEQIDKIIAGHLTQSHTATAGGQ
jgi:S1-C subfamily serine protease